MAAHPELLKSVFEQATAMSPARTFVLKLQSLPEPTQREIAQALAQDTDILAQSLGTLAFKFLDWHEQLLAQYTSPFTRVRKQAIRYSLQLANDAGRVKTTAAQGDSLTIPPDQLYFINQVRILGNAALGAELLERMSHPSSRLGLRFGRSKLLHMLPPHIILEHIQQDPDLLFEISWKHLALQQPDITIQLMGQALETAESQVALNKRWRLVEPAVGRLLKNDRPTHLPAVLSLLQRFALPQSPLPDVICPHLSLLVPPLPKASGPLTNDEAFKGHMEALQKVLLRHSSREVLKHWSFSCLEIPRIARAFKHTPGLLQELAGLKASDVHQLGSFLQHIPRRQLRAELWMSIPQDADRGPAWMRDAGAAQVLFPGLTPQASTALADTLLATRAAQENKELRQMLTGLRWLPDVQAELQADCNVPDAAERGLALSRLLQAAVNSRHGMTEVLAFLAKRLANEQAPVVDGVVSDLAEKVPLELISPDHLPHLQKLRDDAALAEDTMPSTRAALAKISSKILRRRLSACSDLGEDKLLAFALDTLYRDVVQKWHGHQHGLATDPIISLHGSYGSSGDKFLRLSRSKLEVAWPELGPWLAKFRDHDPSLGALVTFCSALLIGPACREHSGFQAEVSKAVFAPRRFTGSTEEGFTDGPGDSLGRVIRAAWAQWPGPAASLAQKVLTSSPSEFNEWAHGEKTFATALLAQKEGFGAADMHIIRGSALDAVACDSSARPSMLDWLEREGLVPELAAPQRHSFWVSNLDGTGFKSQQQNSCPWQWPSDQRVRLASLSCRALAEGLLGKPLLDMPYQLIIVPPAITMLCHSAPDPFQAVEAWLQENVEQSEATLAQVKSIAMRQLPRTQQSSAALRVIAAWAKEFSNSTEPSARRAGKGPQLGSVLSKCSRLASLTDGVPILQDLWAVPTLPLTIRKQIMRCLVSCPGPEANEWLRTLLADFFALHRDVKGAAILEMMADSNARQQDLKWDMLDCCIREGNKELCQSILNETGQQLGQASPAHAQRWAEAILQLASHPDRDLQASLWQHLSAYVSILEPAQLQSIAQAAQALIIQVDNPGLGWQGQAALIVAASSIGSGPSFVQIAAAQLCDLVADETMRPDATSQRDVPARQRLLGLCTNLLTQLRQADVDQRLRDAACHICKDIASRHPQVYHQHHATFAKLRVSERAWREINEALAETLHMHLHCLLQDASDFQQERDVAVAVAEVIRGSSWGSSPGLKHLITRMAQSARAGMRLTAVRGLLVWGKAERWGQAWMLELLTRLRGDDSPRISREAFSLFCFSE